MTRLRQPTSILPAVLAPRAGRLPGTVSWGAPQLRRLAQTSSSVSSRRIRRLATTRSYRQDSLNSSSRAASRSDPPARDQCDRPIPEPSGIKRSAAKISGQPGEAHGGFMVDLVFSMSTRHTGRTGSTSHGTLPCYSGARWDTASSDKSHDRPDADQLGWSSFHVGYGRTWRFGLTARSYTRPGVLVGPRVPPLAHTDQCRPDILPQCSLSNPGSEWHREPVIGVLSTGFRCCAPPWAAGRLSSGVDVQSTSPPSPPYPPP
ncbi:hypothetical protein SAMN04489733_7916 [Amycolatopsis keratiniphila]|nr:hypothetical protein SAMN04489733_7916 [Amycolatopsis keratiniphila]